VPGISSVSVKMSFSIPRDSLESRSVSGDSTTLSKDSVVAKRHSDTLGKLNRRKLSISDLKINSKESCLSKVCLSFFGCYRDSSFNIYEGSLNQPRRIPLDKDEKPPLIRLTQSKGLLGSSFKVIKHPHQLVFNRQMQVAAVGDMEGEIVSAVAAMQSLGVTKMTSDFFKGIPYLKFDLSQLEDHKKLIFLGDILDRGPLGMINLVTLFKLFDNPNPVLEKTFILGNHDLPYLLLPSDADHVSIKLIKPSIFSVKGDPNFSLACGIFEEMNKKGYLKLAEYDPDLAQLTCHAVFTAGDHGFLKKFQNFLSQSTSFRDFLISKKRIDQKIVDMLIAGPDFSNWKEKGPDHSYMQPLVDVINCLIDKDFIVQNKNRNAVLELLMGEGVKSFVFKQGISIYKYNKITEKMCKVPPFADFNDDCFSLPCIRQINGHWPAESRDPGLLTVKTPYGNSEVVKLDCATSSQMLPGGFVAYPVSFLTGPDFGFKKIKVSYQGKGFNIAYFLNELKSRLEKLIALHCSNDAKSQEFDSSWISVSQFSDTSNDIRIRKLGSIDKVRPTSEGISNIPVKAKILLAEFLNSKFNRHYVEELNKIEDLTSLYQQSNFYFKDSDIISINHNHKTFFIKVNNVLKQYLECLIQLYDEFNSKL